jgi:hypothetical protein
MSLYGKLLRLSENNYRRYARIVRIPIAKDCPAWKTVALTTVFVALPKEIV